MVYVYTEENFRKCFIVYKVTRKFCDDLYLDNTLNTLKKLKQFYEMYTIR